MAVIRHEIMLNLFPWLFDVSGEMQQSILVPFDPADYNYDTLSVYLECDLVHANTVGNAMQLHDDGVSRATLTPYNTTRDLRRTTAATGLTSGDYSVYLTNYLAECNLYMARMIIIQDTGTDEVTDTVCYAPIGYYGVYAGTTLTSAAKGYWYYESDNWSVSDATFYCDYTISADSTMDDCEILLYKSATSDGTYALDTTILSGTVTTADTPERFSASFTPTDGYFYRIYVSIDNSMSSITSLGGCIRVEMSNATEVEKFETWHHLTTESLTTGDSDARIYWDTDEWDVTVQSYMECQGYGGNSPYEGSLQKTGTTVNVTGGGVDIDGEGFVRKRSSTALSGMSDDTEYDFNGSA